MHAPRSWRPRHDQSRHPGPRPQCRRPTAMRPRPQKDGSSVRIDCETKRAPSFRIRWRPPSAHQAAAAAGSATGAPHRHHRSTDTITVLDYVMVGAPSCFGLTDHRSSVTSQSVRAWRAPHPPRKGKRLSASRVKINQVVFPNTNQLTIQYHSPNQSKSLIRPVKLERTSADRARALRLYRAAPSPRLRPGGKW